MKRIGSQDEFGEVGPVSYLKERFGFNADNIVKEAKELIEELMQAENPYNCPHGRPTLIVMSKYEVERKFKRIL